MFKQPIRKLPGRGASTGDPVAAALSSLGRRGGAHRGGRAAAAARRTGPKTVEKRATGGRVGLVSEQLLLLGGVQRREKGVGLALEMFRKAPERSATNTRTLRLANCKHLCVTHVTNNVSPRIKGGVIFI